MGLEGIPSVPLAQEWENIKIKSMNPAARLPGCVALG